MKANFFRRWRREPGGGKDDSRESRPKLWSTRSASWLPFEEALDDLVLLGDGTFVAGLEVAPVDTALMSQEEVHAHLARYWQGLRSTHFPVSIYVGTRRQEVADYLQAVTRRLDELAEAQGRQQGFFGMLLEEQCRLLQALLAAHLRSRYTLLIVSHNPSSRLKGAVRRVARERHRAPVLPERLQEAGGELELRLRKVEDVLRHVGLKYRRCSGRRLAAEIQRLARPELAAEDMANLESSLEPLAAVWGNLEEGESYEMAFSTQG